MEVGTVRYIETSRQRVRIKDWPLQYIQGLLLD